MENDHHANPKTINHSSLRNQAMRIIRAEIISGILVQGTLYTIGDTANRLGVSPTPIREALIDLSHDGLVEIVRNRGFRVRKLSDRELDQIVEIRLMLEVPGIERLASQIPAPNVDDLRPISARVDEAAANGDLVDFLALDRDLHLGLLAKLGNPRLVKIVGELRDQTRLYGLWQLVGAEDLANTAREHDSLLDAVASGDAKLASTLMVRHLTHVRGLWAGREERW